MMSIFYVFTIKIWYVLSMYYKSNYEYFLELTLLLPLKGP